MEETKEPCKTVTAICKRKNIYVTVTAIYKWKEKYK